MNTSATGIDAYLSCPRYAAIRKSLPSRAEPAPLMIGTAVHAAAEWGLQQVIDGKPPPHSDEIAAKYEDIVRARENETEVDWGKNEREQALWEGHQASVAAWNVLRSITPREVERQFSLPTIPGRVLNGRIDLIAEDNTRYDLKTAGEKSRWTSAKATTERQPGIYGAEQYIDSGEFDGRFAFLVVTKSKYPSIQRFDVPVSAIRVMTAITVAKIVQRAMDAGIFPPNKRCSGCPGNCEDIAI